MHDLAAKRRYLEQALLRSATPRRRRRKASLVSIAGDNTAPVVVVTGTARGPVTVVTGPAPTIHLGPDLEVPPGLPKSLDVGD